MGMRSFSEEDTMLIRKPVYFDKFHCIAASCPDSCCKEWAVQVDDTSAAYYRSLSGDLGDRLREVLREEDGETVMTIEDGHCPMWRRDGLCRIQAELGESALCNTCRAFPRLTHDYGDFVEFGLELSCPEAAKFILNNPPSPLLESGESDGEAEYDMEAMGVLLATREKMLSILSDAVRPVPETLALALLYGYQAQGELDGGESLPFDENSALEEAKRFAKPGSMEGILDFFLKLELLTHDWEERLRSPQNGAWEVRHLALARYLVERYWLQAVSDYDLYCRVKFIILSCLLVKHLGGDILRTAQLFSKEIENDVDNVETILEGAYSHPALRDDTLLGCLME